MRSFKLYTNNWNNINIKIYCICFSYDLYISIKNIDTKVVFEFYLFDQTLTLYSIQCSIIYLSVSY